MIPTVDHDCGPDALHIGPVGSLGCVLIDGRLLMLPPGDATAQHLVGREREAPHDQAP